MPPHIVPIVVAICTAIGSVVTLIVKWLLDWLSGKPSKHDLALAQRIDSLERSHEEHLLNVTSVHAQALRALLFDKIAKLHAETVEQGKPVPTETKVRVETAFDAYQRLGGNGVGKHYRDEMLEAHARNLEEGKRR